MLSWFFKPQEDAPGMEEKQEFVRKSLKFVIPLEHVSELKQALAENLGVSPFTLSTGEVVHSQTTHSCYFDSDDLVQYHERVRKSEGAKLVRIRWYGDSLKASAVFVERKKHHDEEAKARGKESNKRRFEMDLLDVEDYLDGYMCPDEPKVAASIQRLILTRNLHPKIHTQYTRTSYQNSQVKDLRVTLDENVTCFKEPGAWSEMEARDGRPEGVSTKMPFAVCEVKVTIPVVNPQTKARAHFPSWLVDALNSTGVTKLKISKFCFGCIFLMPEECRILPYWVDPLRQLYPALRDPTAPIPKASLSPEKLTRMLKGHGLVACNGMARPKFSEEKVQEEKVMRMGMGIKG